MSSALEVSQAAFGKDYNFLSVRLHPLTQQLKHYTSITSSGIHLLYLSSPASHYFLQLTNSPTLSANHAATV